MLYFGHSLSPHVSVAYSLLPRTFGDVFGVWTEQDPAVHVPSGRTRQEPYTPANDSQSLGFLLSIEDFLTE